MWFILFCIPIFICFYTLFSIFIRQLRSPLRSLNGPKNSSVLFGNLIDLHDQETTNIFAHWDLLYGSTFIYNGFFGMPRLFTTDPKAISYILQHAYHYPKPDFVRDSLATMAAGHDGILTVEGDHHKRQRKILAPAFSHSHIKSLSPIFWQKALQLRDIWLSHSSGPRIDVLAWLARATLDVIGIAGYYHSSLPIYSISLGHTQALAMRSIHSRMKTLNLRSHSALYFPRLVNSA
jgi:cytochrome P450